MTFLLPDYKPEEAPAFEGPDQQPVGFFEGLGPATSTAMREGNWFWQNERNVRDERRVTIGEPAGERIGIDALNEYYTANDAGYDHLRPAPTTVADFFAMHGKVAEDIVVEMARQQAEQDPDKWKDLDLSDEGVQARVTERDIADQEEEAEILSMMPKYGGITALTGAIIAGITDPRMLPLNAIGVGAGGSTLRVLGREAMLNAGAEAVMFPERVETAERLDLKEPGFVESIATAALAGAAFGGLFRAVPAAFTGVKRGIEYFNIRKGNDKPHVEAATQAAEDAFIAGDDPMAAAKAILDREPAPPEPLIPGSAVSEPDAPSAPVASTIDPYETTITQEALPEVPKPQGKRPRTLKQLVIDSGGIWRGSDAGDLRALEYRRPGFLKKDALERSAAGDNGGGRTISEMREIARDAGYVRPEATDNDFIDALTEDVKGTRRIYSQADETSAKEWEAWDNRSVSKPTRPADDYKAKEPKATGFFVDKDLQEGLLGPDFRKNLEDQFDGWATERGFNLLPRERDEILKQLAKDGGEAEYLVERMFERELDATEAAIIKGGYADAWNDVPFGDGEGAQAIPNRQGRSDPFDTEPSQGTGGQSGTGQGGLRSADEGLTAALQDEASTGRLSVFDDIESPEAVAFADTEIAAIRERLDDPEAPVTDADDGVRELLDEIDENDTLLREYEACMTGGDIGEGLSG